MVSVVGWPVSVPGALLHLWRAVVTVGVVIGILGRCVPQWWERAVRIVYNGISVCPLLHWICTDGAGSWLTSCGWLSVGMICAWSSWSHRSV